MCFVFRLMPYLDSASVLHLLNVLDAAKLCFAVGAAGLDGQLGVLLPLLSSSQLVCYTQHHSMSMRIKESQGAAKLSLQ